MAELDLGLIGEQRLITDDRRPDPGEHRLQLQVTCVQPH